MSVGPKATPRPLIVHIDETGAVRRFAEASAISVSSLSATNATISNLITVSAISATTYLGAPVGAVTQFKLLTDTSAVWATPHSGSMPIQNEDGITFGYIHSSTFLPNIGGQTGLTAGDILSVATDGTLTVITGGSLEKFLTHDGTLPYWDNKPVYALAEISDVNPTGATNGKFLVYNGSTWVASSVVITGVSALSALSDTRILTTPTTGQTLTWSSTKWVASSISIPVIGTSALSSLSDTNITSPTTGQSLVWNGTKWQASTVAGGGGGAGTVTTVSGTNVSNNLVKQTGPTTAIIRDLSAYSNKISLTSATDVIGIDVNQANLDINALGNMPLSVGNGGTGLDLNSIAIGEVLAGVGDGVIGQIVGGSNISITAANISVTAAGSDKQVQFNAAGSLSANSNLTFTVSSGLLQSSSVSSVNASATNARFGTISATTYQNLGIGTSALSGLSDTVITTTPTTGQILTWSATKWVASAAPTGGGGGGATALSGLTDVSSSISPVNGNALIWNGTKWTASAFLPQVYNVKQFGAVGNGSTDDTAAMQAAFLFMNTTASGNTLYLPKGIYPVSSTLVLSSPFNIVGEGSDGHNDWDTYVSASVTYASAFRPISILKYTGPSGLGTCLLAQSGSWYAGTTYKDFALDGNSKANIILDLDRIKRALFENIALRASIGYGAGTSGIAIRLKPKATTASVGPVSIIDNCHHNVFNNISIYQMASATYADGTSWAMNAGIVLAGADTYVLTSTVNKYPTGTVDLFYGANACHNHFNNVRFRGGYGPGLHLKDCDNNHFTNYYVECHPTGLLDAPGSTGQEQLLSSYPHAHFTLEAESRANYFYHIQGYVANKSVGKNNIFGFDQENGQANPVNITRNTGSPIAAPIDWIGFGKGYFTTVSAGTAILTTVSATTYQNLGIGTSALSGLSDTTITTPSNGNVLVWNGSKWINAGITFAPLSALSDVDISGTPTNGQTLTWSSTKWVPSSTFLKAAGSTGQVQYNVAGNLSASPNLIFDAANGQLQSVLFQALTISGSTISATTYQNLGIGTSALSGLSDVTATPVPTTGQSLVWNGTRWQASTPATGGTGTLTSVTGTNVSNNLVKQTGPTTAIVRDVSAGSSKVSLTSATDYIAFDITPGNIVLSSLSGTLPVSKGGTGLNSITTDKIPLGTGTEVLTTVGIGTNLVNSGGNINVTAAGSTTQVQFNDGGTNLGGNSNLTFNKTIGLLQSSSVSSVNASATSGMFVTVSATTYQNLGIGTSALSSLSDTVILATPSNAQALVWSSTKWVPSSISFPPSAAIGTSALSGLSDTTITGTPTNSQALVWSSTKWVPSSIPNALSADSDTFITATPTTGQVLAWSATKWVVSTVTAGGGATALSGLTDTLITTPADGNALVWSSTASKWVPGSVAAGAGAPAGTLQFNNGGSLNGTEDLKWNSSTLTLSAMPTVSVIINNLSGINFSGTTVTAQVYNNLDPSIIGRIHSIRNTEFLG